MNRRDHRTKQLRDALLDFAPSDARERGFLQRMLELLASPGDPFDRDHFVPGHFTASAFVLSPCGEEVLMILHGKLGIWVQPGGHVDPEDEDIFAAALREVAEEVGVVGARFAGGAPSIFDVDIHDIPARKGDPAHAHFDVRVLLVAPDAAFEVGSDARAARWRRLDSIQPAETDESVLRAVRKVLQRV